MKPMNERALTVTSYAILGQLILRPWSMYGMTKNMGRTLHWFWPRAESQIYAEAKRLVELGLAHAEGEERGRRPRTVYSITPEGRAALRTWLGESPGGFSLHFEPLLRVHLALAGTRDDLIAAVTQARDESESLLQQAITIGAEFAEGRHQFQDQVHIRALVFDFLWHFGLAMYLWAERTLEEVAGWDDLELGDKGGRAVALIRQALAGSDVLRDTPP
jgi:DNA-binding PadR family transcriptional regulator